VKAYFAWKLKLEVAKTTREEEDDVSTRRREKWTMVCDITLPFSGSLQEGWEEGSPNFPDVIEDEVEAYMQPSTKAMKQRKSLLNTGHVNNVKFHHISTDLKYCFTQCRCVPEEKTSSDSCGFAYTRHRCTRRMEKSFLLMSCDRILYKLGRGHRLKRIFLSSPLYMYLKKIQIRYHCNLNCSACMTTTNSWCTHSSIVVASKNGTMVSFSHIKQQRSMFSRSS